MLPLQNSFVTNNVCWRVLTVVLQQRRANTLWATKRKKKTAVDKAVDYFDTVYEPIFNKRWPSIRLALLSPHKYCAVVNNFGDTESICTQLQNEGAINIREMFDIQKNKLSEKNSDKERKKELKHIYKLDKQIEKIAARKFEEEISQIYPEGAERPSTNVFDGTHSLLGKQDLSDTELIKKAKTPLEESLAEATIDVNRQIDPSEGFSSSRLNDYVPVSKIKGKEGFISEAEHFSIYNEAKDFPVDVEVEETLNFPPHLQIYTFDQGEVASFTPPKTGSTGVLGHYLMDAGSIIPVLALDLRPGDHVLDMCAAPGGKSLLCLQTLYPDLVVCNDLYPSRINRLRHVMDQYFYDWQKRVVLSQCAGEEMVDSARFDKILVDVPCTNDRLSVTEADNNIFNPSRAKERILLPQTQVAILAQALKLVKKGGNVVYSTCSLNPAQNDGVVQMALQRIWEETSLKIVVKDLRGVLEPTKVVFQYAEPQCLRYGSMVVPYLPANFGPMYFCKLQRIE